MIGEYSPTEKNGLVRGLYRSLGFELESHDAGTGREVWRFATRAAGQLPVHHAQLCPAA